MLLTITADRDSVCAADDCVPHSRAFSIAASCTTLQILAAAWQACPLALIAGGEATLLINIVGQQGSTGVMAQRWSAPRLIVPPETSAHDLFKGSEKPSIHFRYWGQSNPDEIFEAVRTNTSLPAWLF